MITPTDVAGWIAFAPRALVLFLILLAIAGLLENTERGRQLVERAIQWVVR